MNTADVALESSMSDEIVRLLLSVARRADELTCRRGSAGEERDFWKEAEVEVLAEMGVGL